MSDRVFSVDEGSLLTLYRKDIMEGLLIVVLLVALFVGAALATGAVAGKWDEQREANGNSTPSPLSRWIDSAGESTIREYARRARTDNWEEHIIRGWIKSYDGKGYDTSPLQAVLDERVAEIIAFAETPWGVVLSDKTGFAFELWVAAQYAKKGWSVKVANQGADGGIDIHATTNDGQAVAIQCKRKLTSKVGVGVVREMATAGAGSRCIIVTTIGFTALLGCAFFRDHLTPLLN